MSWWNNVNFSDDADITPEWWFFRARFKEACEEGKTIYNFKKSGYLAKGVTPKKIEKEIINCGTSLTFFASSSDKEENGKRFFSWDQGFVEFTPSYTSGHLINIFTTEKAKGIKIAKAVGKLLLQRVPSGRVKMLVSSAEGNSLVDIGTLKSNIELDNYTEKVKEEYDFVKTELSTKTPSGRIILLEGEPGTGKSYFIRGLVNDVNAWFIYVPATMIGSLTGPGIVRALMRRDYPEDSSDDEKPPMILIVEDADSGLVKRRRGDPNQLAELLNISDGIFGELADIRIIASTNAKLIEMDEAILRPGRLSTKINFTKLDFKQSSEIYKKLTKKPLTEKEKDYTLAEVYRMAREDGWKPETRKKVKEGYGEYI